MLASQKIFKKNGEKPTALETQVASALVDLQSSQDLSENLFDLYISSVKEVDLGNSKSAYVIFVPYRLHARFQKIQQRLVRELEKKFSGKHVVFLAQRTILPKSYVRKSGGQLRARSRTLTSVHNNILEDMVYPTQVVGRRTRYRLDGTKLLKVYLDSKDSKDVDYKLKTYATIYNKLTNKNVQFMFPVEED